MVFKAEGKAMIISASIVQSFRYCYSCGKASRENTTRLFGHSDCGEKPYVLYACGACASKCREIVTALCKNESKRARK
jgi:hypothetical protein